MAAADTEAADGMSLRVSFGKDLGGGLGRAVAVAVAVVVRRRGLVKAAAAHAPDVPLEALRDRLLHRQRAVCVHGRARVQPEVLLRRIMGGARPYQQPAGPGLARAHIICHWYVWYGK